MKGKVPTFLDLKGFFPAISHLHISTATHVRSPVQLCSPLLSALSSTQGHFRQLLLTIAMAGGHLVHRHLGRKSSHRQALLRNLVASLFTHESITTTWPKAKEAQKMAEKLITLGKRNTEAARNKAQQAFYVSKGRSRHISGPEADVSMLGTRTIHAEIVRRVTRTIYGPTGRIYSSAAY